VRGVRVGVRTLLAATCVRCGRLLAGAKFCRYVRPGDSVAYLDYRCTACKWGIKVSSNAR
jgi:phage FluMu protein Com